MRVEDTEIENYDTHELKEKSGWWLPATDTFFGGFLDAAVYKPGAPGKSNGFMREHLEAAFKWVKNWELAVDAGAHVGFWAWDIAHRFGQVHAFEPTPVTYKCLRRNLAGLASVQLYNRALGNKPGMCQIVEDETRNGNSGSNFIRPGSGNIPVITLDSLNLPTCGLLKIDVEGYELPVLEGGRQLIRQHNPVIIIEMGKKLEKRFGFDEHTVRDWLRMHSYREVAYMRPDRVYVRQKG